jgi:hypothetical protein
MDNFDAMYEFSNVIFDKVNSGKIEYIDAIVSYCDEQELDIDSIISLISPALKSKMEEEAIALRLVKANPRLTF